MVDFASSLEMVGFANVALVSGEMFVLCHLAETQCSPVRKGGEGRRGRWLFWSFGISDVKFVIPVSQLKDEQLASNHKEFTHFKTEGN